MHKCHVQHLLVASSYNLSVATLKQTHSSALHDAHPHQNPVFAMLGTSEMSVAIKTQHFLLYVQFH